MPYFDKQTIVKLFMQKHDLTQAEFDKLCSLGVSDLHDPQLLMSASMWVRILQQHIHEPIAIVPDYDADGVGSGSLLYAGLSVLGVDVVNNVYLYPPRTSTGYGLSVKAVDEILSVAPNTKVLITTDNGIKAYDGISYAKSKGLTVLVSDHHIGSEREPIADVIVNPNRFGDTYPFKSISGTTVIWKLLLHYADMYGTPEQQGMIMNLIVLSGITTISDVMKMLDENRFMVKVMVNMLSNPDYLKSEMIRGFSMGYVGYGCIFQGLYAIMTVLSDESKLKYGVDEDTVGFYLAPILNSPRRMSGSSEVSFKLFTSLTYQNALDVATELFTLNEQRKAEVNVVSKAVIDHITEVGSSQALVTVANTRGGFAGLISGKLTNLYDLPTVVFSYVDETSSDGMVSSTTLKSLSDANGQLAGSGRSPEWFNLYKALQEIQSLDPSIFISQGGHAQAAGLHIHASKLDKFTTLFKEQVANVVSQLVSAGEKEMATSSTIDPRAISLAFDNHVVMYEPDLMISDSADLAILADAVRYFEGLRPFGEGFRKQLFATVLSYDMVEYVFMGAEKQHVKMTLPNGFVIIQWNGADELNRRLAKGSAFSLNVVGTLSLNEFRGKTTVQLMADIIKYVP